MANFKVELPKERSSIIKVIGVGGGGGNAVNYMYKEGITGVDFVICNTDCQALETSSVPNKIQIGNELTNGRGAGSNPEVGKKAAECSIDEIADILGVNTQMVFITAGMGGGTGTGAAPVIARIAKEMGILTVGIVTLPFSFEGSKRILAAEKGIIEMKESVDSLLVISNDRIIEIYGKLLLSEAFNYADNVLATAAKGIAEIITVAGSLNVDFEDVKTAMQNSGVAILGNGVAEGEGRALIAAQEALNSPLLNDNKIEGAQNLLINITSKKGEGELTMDEYSQINNFFQEQAGFDANLKCGVCFDESLDGKISVTVIATSFNRTENTLKTEVPETQFENNFKVEQTEKSEKFSEKIETDDVKYMSLEEDIPFKKEDIKREVNKIKNLEYTSRLKELRELNQKSKSENGREELENTPAYERKNIKLDEVSHSSESNVSRFSLVDEPERKPELKSNNSFLHDNVD
ncbi:MAG: cell division protein FtsZ [Bacteroidetes bacterium]|nr:cell division protein FtsZ [Bacteroidota bacterium]